MVNRRTRSNRRRRNRRSHNRSRQEQQQQCRSLSRSGDESRSAYSNEHSDSFSLTQPSQHRNDRRNQRARSPAPAAGHLHQATSVVSSAFNRITEFLRPDRKAAGGLSAVIFDETCSNSSGSTTVLRKDPDAFLIEKPAASKLIFQCQLAHGSPTALISEFKNPTELYQKIADSYDEVELDQILFCTRNTHRIDMDAILSGTLTTTDFIFAHLRGQKKEVEVVKKGRLLGVTLSDNWAGRVFIRRIDPGSQLAASRPVVDVGDHIEAVNGESVVGKRHYQVARMLQKIRPGSTFTLRLISPLKSGFSFIAPRAGARKPTAAVPVIGAMDGAQTIRFKSDGSLVTVEEPTNKVIINRLNDVFDRYLGFNDDELANTVLDIGRECATLNDMEKRCRTSSLKDFEFTPEFLFDLWGAVDDWKHNRLGSAVPEPGKPAVAENLQMVDSKEDAVARSERGSNLHDNDENDNELDVESYDTSFTGDSSFTGGTSFHTTTTTTTTEQKYDEGSASADDSIAAYVTADADDEMDEEDDDEDVDVKAMSAVPAHQPPPPQSAWQALLAGWKNGNVKSVSCNNLDVD